MSKIQKVPVPYKKDGSLQDLIKQYLQKTEELDNKEERVIKQFELMQSAMSSLQQKNQRRFSRTIQEPVHPKLQEIEEETQKIKEETLRIQREIREKKEENKKLQREIEQRKLQKKIGPNDLVPDVGFLKEFDGDIELKNSLRLEIESRVGEEADDEYSNDEGPNIQFFNDKLRKLKKMRKKLSKETEEESKATKNRMNKLKEKVEMLEWQSELNRQLLRAAKK